MDGNHFGLVFYVYIAPFVDYGGPRARYYGITVQCYEWH